MTPKEKAKDLVEKFKLYSWISYIEGYKEFSNIESAKYCALIAVDEILNTEIGDTVLGHDYWQEVKQEIENI